MQNRETINGQEIVMHGKGKLEGRLRRASNAWYIFKLKQVLCMHWELNMPRTRCENEPGMAKVFGVSGWEGACDFAHVGSWRNSHKVSYEAKFMLTR